MKYFVLLPIFATTILTAGPLMAQTPTQTGMMGQDGPSMPMMHDGAPGGMGATMGMAQHVEGRIAFLRTELKITDGQLPQWNAFAEALRANARRMTGMHGMMGQGASQSAPEHLDHMEAMMTDMLETVRSTKAALTPLYAVLSDEQKKTADTLLHGPMGIMKPM
jgi:LTXXQ motif family protein